MRRFVVTNPNLSVGSHGDMVDADELCMDDDQLDEWCDAGYGMELFDDTAIGDVITHMSTAISDDDDAVVDERYDFDPADHSVAVVQAHIEAHPEQGQQIVADERMGKNRSGIVNGW